MTPNGKFIRVSYAIGAVILAALIAFQVGRATADDPIRAMANLLQQ